MKRSAKIYDEELRYGAAAGSRGQRSHGSASSASWESPFGAGWSSGAASSGGIPDEDLFGMFFGSRGAADRAGFFSRAAAAPVQAEARGGGVQYDAGPA
ncbi:hypothetical protein ACFSQ7_50015 [Paenibacillus rhizoplanae]